MEGMNFNSMQISLDQMLPIMFSQVQDLAAGREQDIQSFNTFFRVLYNKGIITEEDIFNSLKQEYQLFIDIGRLKTMPSDEEINQVVNGMLLWIKADKDEVSEVIKQHQKELEEMKRKYNSKIDVVSGDALNILNSKDPKKLII